MHTKTYLITGGTAGIGFSLAKSLKLKGHRVIITGRDTDRVATTAANLDCIGYVADSENLNQISQLANDLSKDNITLNGLVLNAGVFHPKSFMQSTPEDFDTSININTKGPFFTLQKLAPLMANPASVVFVSSIVVHKAFEGCSIYSASKAAFEGVVRVANLELAPLSIRINSVQPGVTATEIQSKAGMSQDDKEAFFDTLQSTPLGRVLNPQDQVGAIEFLLSDASLALRNAIIEVAGGQTL